MRAPPFGYLDLDEPGGGFVAEPDFSTVRRQGPGTRVTREEGADAGRAERALAAAEIGIWDWDVQTGRVHWDENLARLHGVDPESVSGSIEALLAVVHPDDVENLRRAIDSFSASGGSFLIEYRVVDAGRTRWVQGRGAAVCDVDGTVVRLIGLAMDTTRLRTERDRAEAALERGSRLQEITSALADALTVADVAASVLRFTRRALDTLFAGIALIDDSGRFLEFQEVGNLPSTTRAEWGRVSLSVHAPITVVARSGRGQFHESTAMLVAEYPSLLDTLALDGQGAFATLPLVSGGRPIGVLSVSWPESRLMSSGDREFLSVVAGQCSQAIERARLFERERATAQTLQRALLPDLRPVMGQVRCAGRYLPAELGVDIGGDWYDAFTLLDDSVALVIGDVAGHGLPAAATMAELRTMLRAYAFEAASPSNVLGSLDAVLVETGSEQFATCCYALFDPATWTLSVATAGHPPPVVIVPGAEPRLLDVEPSPLLGAGGCPKEHRFRVARGTRLVFFTDGLVERRARAIDVGISEVLASVRTPPHDLEGLCDTVLQAAALSGPREDDVCVLAASLGHARRSRRHRRGRS